MDSNIGTSATDETNIVQYAKPFTLIHWFGMTTGPNHIQPIITTVIRQILHCTCIPYIIQWHTTALFTDARLMGKDFHNYDKNSVENVIKIQKK